MHGWRTAAICYFPSHVEMTVLIDVLRLGAKFGDIWGFRPSFLLVRALGNWQNSAFWIKAMSCVKVRKCRLTVVGESEFNQSINPFISRKICYNESK